jgi:DNA-binding IclR family transcriptional regulator
MQKFVGPQGIAVLAWFHQRGERGGTQREVSEALGITRASVAARVHALEKVGNLRKTKERKAGCFVYRAVN